MLYGSQVGTLHGYVGPHRRGQIKQDMAQQVVGHWTKNKSKYLLFDWAWGHRQNWILGIGPCLVSPKPSPLNYPSLIIDYLGKLQRYLGQHLTYGLKLWSKS